MCYSLNWAISSSWPSQISRAMSIISMCSWSATLYCSLGFFLSWEGGHAAPEVLGDPKTIIGIDCSQSLMKNRRLGKNCDLFYSVVWKPKVHFWICPFAACLHASGVSNTSKVNLNPKLHIKYHERLEITWI